jgi:ATP-dependent helicase HrpB
VIVAALMDDEIGEWGGDSNLTIRVKECLSASPTSAKGRAILKYAARISNTARDETLKAMNDVSAVDIVSDVIGQALLPGFIDLVAQFKGEASYGGCTYKLSLGQSARLDGSRDEGKYILVIDTSTGDDGITRIRAYAKIDLNHLNQVSKEYREVYAVQSKGYEVRARKVTKVGHLELSSTTLPSPSSDEVAKVLVDTIVDLGGVYKAIIPLQPKKVIYSLSDLKHRIRLARKLTSEESWPPCFRALDNSEKGIQTAEDDKILLDLVEPWLIATGSLKGLDMFEILSSSLTAEQQAELDSIVPTKIVAPDGTPITVDYTNDTPTVSAKLQQFFGTTNSPSIGPVNNLIPLSISLLSPSGKQLALCNDLHFFWKETYPSVRAEMRGQYPKHPWPEDPFTTEPSRLSKKQQQNQRIADDTTKVDKRKEKRISRKKKK